MVTTHGSGRRRSWSPSRSGFGSTIAVIASGEILQVRACDAAPPLAERLEVARRLRADQPAEAERLARDRQLVAVVLDHLQKEARVRPALVKLAGRVQVARAE